MRTRTQEQVVERMRATRRQDVLNWKAEVLVTALDFEHAREFLVADATADGWDDPRDDEQLLAAATGYLEFAFGKAYHERGISAERSVTKLAEYAWLLGRDELAERMDRGADYAPYGLPLLREFAAAFGLPAPSREEVLGR